MAFTFRVAAPHILQGLALIAALAGGLVWSSLLLTPAESNAPVTTSSDPVSRADSPALHWFSSQPVMMDIKVFGVMAAKQGAVAIISLNDGPPRSFLAGDGLANGVRVSAIDGDAVIVEQGSQQHRFNVSTLPDSPVLPRLIRP